MAYGFAKRPKQWDNNGLTTSFSLELLAVIFIIGLIVGLALPHLQSVFKRAQVAEGLNLMVAGKNEIALYYSLHGRLPDWSATDLEARGIKISGRYVDSVGLQGTAQSVSFQNPGLAGELSLRLLMPEKPVSSTAPPLLTWLCGYRDAPSGLRALEENRTNIQPAYLPFICRHGQPG